MAGREDEGVQHHAAHCSHAHVQRDFSRVAYLLCRGSQVPVFTLLLNFHRSESCVDMIARPVGDCVFGVVLGPARVMIWSRSTLLTMVWSSVPCSLAACSPAACCMQPAALQPCNSQPCRIPWELFSLRSLAYCVRKWIAGCTPWRVNGPLQRLHSICTPTTKQTGFLPRSSGSPIAADRCRVAASIAFFSGPALAEHASSQCEP